MPTALVSRCLLGVPCRYHGRAVPPSRRVAALALRCSLVPVCPEVDGGLPTPRPPARLQGERVLSGGADVTEAFERGAEAAIEAARASGATKAYLVRGSPSCDKRRGVAALALARVGVRVIAV